MDLQDQLKKLFPDHQTTPTQNQNPAPSQGLWISAHPLECHFEKRHGKPHTIIKKYDGNKQDFKTLTQELKKMLGVGGSHKKEEIIIQGDYRKQIMEYLKKQGFQVKRVGG